MKRIKKITASLLALAITAAGMSSIPASAAGGNATRNFAVGNYSATASVYVTASPRTYVDASTTSYSNNVYWRYVYLQLTTTNDIFMSREGAYSRTGNSYVSMNTPSGTTIASTQSWHSGNTSGGETYGTWMYT